MPKVAHSLMQCSRTPIGFGDLAIELPPFELVDCPLLDLRLVTAHCHTHQSYEGLASGLLALE